MIRRKFTLRSRAVSPAAASVVVAAALAAWAGTASAATYKVGPSEETKQLADIADDLKPGDVVEIEGGQTYEPVHLKESGTAEAKITIRGLIVDGKRPVFANGEYSAVFDGDHYIAENLEFTGGSEVCLVHKGDDLTVRNALIHDCPQHGVLSNDDEAGSLTIEYSEVYACGKGEQKHQVYVTANSETYPNAVFRLQNSYVHDGNGGNNIKSRARRNEIYYNWVEAALYHALDLIGPDNGERFGGQREDSDVVGNVLWVTGDWHASRIGGDGTGATGGRYRFVNNTIIMAGSSDVAIRLQEEVESLELHNNVFYSPKGAAIDLVRETDGMKWVGGSPGLAGSNNWIQDSWLEVPADWPGTIRGSEPGFRSFEDGDLRPADDSVLLNASSAQLVGPSGRDFPGPLASPQCLPPIRALQASGESIGRASTDGLDIGAFEGGPPSAAAAGSCVAAPSNVGSGPTNAPPGNSGGGSGSGSGNGSGSGSGSGNGSGSGAGNGNESSVAPGNTVGGGCSAAPAPRASSLAALVVGFGLALAGLRRRSRGV